MNTRKDISANKGGKENRGARRNTSLVECLNECVSGIGVSSDHVGVVFA
jgi:hypothetical protein